MIIILIPTRQDNPVFDLKEDPEGPIRSFGACNIPVRWYPHGDHEPRISTLIGPEVDISILS